MIQTRAVAATLRTSQWWAPLSTAAVLLIGAAVMVAGSGWLPTGDAALLELRLRAMPADPPELGVYSRLGWWHPGPAFFWAMRLIGVPFGGDSLALIMAMAVIHVVALVLAWWLLRQVSPTAAPYLLLAAVAVIASRGADFVVNPWNPYVGIVGALTLLAAGIGLANRQAWGAAALAPVATFLVQSHVGYLPLAVIVAGAAVLLATVGWRTVDPAPAWPITALLAGGALSLLMWWQPLVQQLTGDPGNLSAIAAGTAGGDTLGLPAAAQVMAAPFAVPPQWGTGFLGALPSTTSVPWLLLLPAIATVTVVVRRRVVAMRVLAIGWVAVGAGAVSAANIQPPAYEYLLPWLASVAAALMALAVWALMDGRQGAPTLSTIVAAAAVVVAVVVAVQWARSEPILSERGRAAGSLTQAVLADAQGAPFAVVVDRDAVDAAVSAEQAFELERAAAGVATGIVLAAAKDGADVGTDPATALLINDVVPTTGPGRTTYVVRVLTNAPSPTMDSRSVAVYDPFTAQQWSRITQLDARLSQADLDPLTRLALAEQRNAITGGQIAYEVRRAMAG